MTMERTGRFQDYDAGSGIVEGYRDAVQADPFTKKYIARNMKQYGTLKKEGLGDPDKLKKLKGVSDTGLEAIAAKAVISKAGVKRKKLPTKYNAKKYNIKRAKAIIAKKQAGASVRKQTLQATRAARMHVLRINRNREIMRSPLYEGLPQGW